MVLRVTRADVLITTDASAANDKRVIADFASEPSVVSLISKGFGDKSEARVVANSAMISRLGALATCRLDDGKWLRIGSQESGSVIDGRAGIFVVKKEFVEHQSVRLFALTPKHHQYDDFEFV